MKAQCLPFRLIPHTTSLFNDFLSDYSRVESFYARPPYFAEWVRDETSRLRYDQGRRERVSAVLERQNRNWGASPKTLEHIARLRRGASAIVTGQQVGLFGGPAFSIYKALTAIKLADEATAVGLDCVPIFWLATEDHDLAEVNHISLPGADFSPQLLSTTTAGPTDAPVSTIQFGQEIVPVVEAAASLLGDSEATTLLRECYRPGNTLGDAFALLFARVFGERGVILLDPADPEFHAIAQPIYHAAAERSSELDRALLDRGKELESAGYHQQVKVTPSSTLLFALRDGARLSVHRRTNGNGNGDFLIGDQRIPEGEMLRRIDSAPHHFSANVLLRPVVQDYLLPTLVYTGGAAEVAYFAQAAVVYETLMGRVTPILPRFSATIVEQKPESLLERYRIGLTDLFHGPETLHEQLGEESLPKDLKNAFHEAAANTDTSLSAIRDALAKLDVTLIDAAKRAESKMQYQIERLQKRAARAEVQRLEVLGRHASLLSNALYPEKGLQEREIGGIYFLARYGKELLDQLYPAVHTDCLDHQVITL